MLTKTHKSITANITRFARYYLSQKLGVYYFTPDCSQITDIPFQKINVTLRYLGKMYASMSGNGDTLIEAIKNTIDNCFDDKRMDHLLLIQKINEFIIEVWIQYNSKPVKNELKQISESFIRGYHGIELKYGYNYAYYKPSVPITSGISSIERILQKLSVKSGLGVNDWKNEGVKINITKWSHFVENEENSFKFCKSFRPVQITPDDLEEALHLTGKRLLSIQDEQGVYAYEYNPIKNVINNSSFNMTRMAGTTYSISKLAHMSRMGKDDYYTSAKKGIEFLLSRMEQKEGLFYISEGESRKKQKKGKLGAMALTLLALQYNDFRVVYKTEKEKLISSIIKMQNIDGSFNCYIHNYNNPNSQNFFPGEALLALTHEYINSANKSLKNNIERAFPFYQNHFFKRPETAFVLWQSDTWSLYAKHLNNLSKKDYSKYCIFVFQQADWILRFQYTTENSPIKEFIGGFRYPGIPGCSTATYVEAIIRAYQTAKMIDDKLQIEKYKTASLEGLKFIIRLQVKSSEKYLLKNEKYAIGGITSNIASFAMRNDNDQHAITAFMAALESPEILEETLM